MTKKVLGLPKFVTNLLILIAVIVVWTAGVYAIAAIINWVSPPKDNEPVKDEVCTTQPLVPENCSN